MRKERKGIKYNRFMTKTISFILFSSVLFTTGACQSSQNTSASTKTITIGSAELKLTENMCFEEDTKKEGVQTGYIYYQPEIPEKRSNMCFLVYRPNNIDYSEVNISSEKAEEIYKDAFPKVTDSLFEANDYTSKETEITEFNGYPAYHFNYGFDHDAYIEGYTILTDKYDTLLLANFKTADIDNHEEFQWIMDHVSGKQFVMGNETKTYTTVKGSPNSSTSSSNGDLCVKCHKNKVTHGLYCNNCYNDEVKNITSKGVSLTELDMWANGYSEYDDDNASEYWH